MHFVSHTEEFDGSKGGIWVCAENGDTFNGQEIYKYYNDSEEHPFGHPDYELGTLKSWENELNKRGWFTQFYDPGTVVIYQI